MPKLSQTLLLAALAGVGLASACSKDDTTLPPIDYAITIVQLDDTDLSMSDEVPLRCDGTLVVQIETDPPAPNQFLLRPANSCGVSTRCGYVHIEGLDRNGDTLASVDTATNQGV
ncbi:MAG TPA: hypothetical protein VEQ59_20495, partial [Polyangiaceae bacterium]|nr:hypothetical protein [Polyangiaceae bacterium]